jgi:hypothetical protein
MKVVLAVLVGLLIAAPAFSSEELVTIDGKNIKITGVSGSNDPKINTSNMKDGVVVFTGSLKDGGYQNVSKMIKDRLIMRGIKVTDKVEGSSYGLWIGIDKGISMDSANKNLAHSMVPDSNKVSGMAIQAAGFAKNLGNNGLVGYVAGAIFDGLSDSKVVLRVNVVEKPAIQKGWFDSIGLMSLTNNFNTKIASISYVLEKGKEASDDIVLKMAVDKWIDTFVVFDAPPATTPVAIETTPENIDSTDLQISMNAISGVTPANSLEQK